MLSRLVITFLPKSKRLLIPWLQSPSAVILEPRKINSATVSPSICHEVMGLDAMILVFWMLSFKPIFSLSSFTFIKRLQSCSKKKKCRKMQDNSSLFIVDVSHCFFYAAGFLDFSFPWSMSSLLPLIVTSLSVMFGIDQCCPGLSEVHNKRFTCWKHHLCY